MNSRLFLFVIGTFIIGTDDFVIAGILPNIARDLEVSIVAAGQLVTAFAFAYAISAPVLGALTFQYPLKKLLVISMLLFTLSNGLSAIVPSFEWLLVTRIVAAMSAALFTPLAMAASASLVPETQRGRALSFITAGITVGLIAGAPIGTWIGHALGWRFSFLFVASIGLFTTLGMMALLPKMDREGTLSLKERLTSLRPQVLLTLLVSIIGTIGGFATYTYIAPILSTITSLDNISWLLLLIGLGSLFGNLIGGYSTDRIGAAKTLQLSLGGFSLVLVFFSLLMWLTPGYTTIVLASIVALLWGIPGFALNPALNSYLISLNPKQASMILSFGASALYIGIGLGAVVGGAVIHISSIHMVGIASAILVCVALAVFRIVQQKYDTAPKHHHR
ncbi:MFS transporter [Brevibacillus sp. 179-C9.3 HS]|uniref:MFS transporter n=1 Tax=unclassified Brevibacillus TaxID=2684853 RepID=UPI00399FFAD6